MNAHALLSCAASESDLNRVSYKDILGTAVLTPAKLSFILKEYKGGKISKLYLIALAEIILHSDKFVSLQHYQEDFYEGMWHILQTITTPFIDGEIESKDVDELLEYLALKYDVDQQI